MPSRLMTNRLLSATAITLASNPCSSRIRLSLAELSQQRTADVADADNHERQRLARLEKPLMDHVERARLLRGVDDAGDVALGRALRDGADGDVVPPERPEHFPGDIRSPFIPSPTTAMIA